MLSALLAFLLGVGILAWFISPSQWLVAVRQVTPHDLGWATAFFFLGCLTMTERWRACLAYRVGFGAAFHSLGIAMIGNLLIPGRSGEPLRVYALAQKGFPAELSTSGVVQERLADQLFRIIAFAVALVLAGASGGGAGANGRLLGILLATLAVFGAIGLMVRYRLSLSRTSGRWFGRLPKLNPEFVERFVRNTLTDLAHVWTRPGGPQALVWGALSWLVLTVQTNFILDSFFGPGSLTLACVAMAFGTPTTSGKPGYYHFVLVASMMAFSADKELALKAAVVLHLYQGIFFTLWGVIGWFALRAGPSLKPAEASAPEVLAEGPR